MAIVTPPNRRAFLRTALGASGALIIGCDGGDGGGVTGDITGDETGDDAGDDQTPDATGDEAVDATGAETDAETPDAMGSDDAMGGDDAAAGPDAGGGQDAMGEDDAGADDAWIEEDTGPDIEPPPACDDPFAGGTYLGDAEILSGGSAPLDTPIGSGLDGRLYTDLETLTADTLLTPIDDFFIRTRLPDQIDYSQPWKIQIGGLVGESFSLSMEDLEPLIQPMGTVLLECSGNGDFAHFGMLSATEWHGIPIQAVFDMIDILPEATQVLIGGFDGHSQPSFNSTAGCEWVFPIEWLTAWGAFLATHMGGEPLTEDHGWPIRLMVPRWYGCTCVKWLDQIRFVDDLEPATSQMKEFASRTHQLGTPALAKDYIAANMDQTAMPVRVEKWKVDDEILYKVVGIMWGGEVVTDKLQIQLGDDTPYVDVDVCPEQATNDTWTLWSHAWKPDAPGTYVMRCRIDDPDILTKRLDSGFYDRVVSIGEV